MEDDGAFPLNEEHLEANQNSLDKKRYEFVSKLTPEEQVIFKKMEEAVVMLIDMKRPFMLLSAPTDNNMFWQYQSYSNLKPPFSEEEAKKVMARAWFCFTAHAQHFTKMTGDSITFMDADNKPYYVITPDKQYKI